MSAGGSGWRRDQRDLAAALLDLGVSVEAMEHAHARGRLQDAIFDMVLDPERVKRTVSVREIEDAAAGRPGHARDGLGVWVPEP